MENNVDEILNNLYKRLGRNLVIQKIATDLKNKINNELQKRRLSENGSELSVNGLLTSEEYRLLSATQALNVKLSMINNHTTDDIINIWNSQETQPIYETLTDLGISDTKSLLGCTDGTENEDVINYLTDVLKSGLDARK